MSEFGSSPARGPLNALVDWFRSALESRSALTSLSLCVVGLLLIARGLERWRVVAFMYDTGGSRSPTPYLTPFSEWRRSITQAGLENRWYVAVSNASQITVACSALEEISPWFGRKLAILAADEQVARGRTSCSAVMPAMRSDVSVLSASYLALGPAARTVLRGGVALLDDGLAIRYASRDPAALSRIPLIIALYAENRKGVAAK